MREVYISSPGNEFVGHLHNSVARSVTVLSSKITLELPTSSLLYGPDGNTSQALTLKHRESNTEMAEAFARSLLAGHGVSGEYEVISDVKRGELLVVDLSLGQPSNTHARALETRLVRVMGGVVTGSEDGTYQKLYNPTVISAPEGSIGSAENLFLTPLDPFASKVYNVDGTSVSIEIDLGMDAETPLVFHFAYQNPCPRVPTNYSVSVDGAIVGSASLGVIRFQPGFVSLTTTNAVVGKRRLIITYSDKALMATTGSIRMYQILVASEGLSSTITTMVSIHQPVECGNYILSRAHHELLQLIPPL
jgi:hypothetical protein